MRSHRACAAPHSRRHGPIILQDQKNGKGTKNEDVHSSIAETRVAFILRACVCVCVCVCVDGWRKVVHFWLKRRRLVVECCRLATLPTSPLLPRFGAFVSILVVGAPPTPLAHFVCIVTSIALLEAIMSAAASAPRHRRYVDMTPEREQKITQLVQLMKETYDPLPKQLQILLSYSPTSEDAPTPHNTTRSYCYCALISCQWEVQKAFEAMKKNVAYRLQCHLDERSELPSAVSIRGWNEMEVVRALGKEERAGNQRADEIIAKLDRYFPCGLHYWDRYGQPVFYLMLGSVDEENLLKELKQTTAVGESVDAVMWEMLQHLLGSGEWLAYYQQMQYDAGQLKVDASEGLIRATTIVVDLLGFTYKMIWKPAIDLFVTCLKTLFAHYPECVHRILVVNAPSMVTLAYGIIRHVLPGTVQAKVHMAKPSASLALLQEHIEKQYVPEFYGGACHCQGGCVRSYRPKNAANGTTTVDQDDAQSAAE
ncbi:hypothetical protein LMJF_31_2070 [Leishmania major strain Friedlin]|uniref:CRAL-TRIO domain-containing protein n=1 Tax=Leishmania major TaxID=5664 RepID=Q4Q655_LEIMA|nr:hypothetical protein LMJF_31_2070 [Leishmania major strain Friedlin]CAJ08395.1 hypothetical protein LMJF_31_2070 [Leishmania major strain Friedlin]|eukprot:XP_001685193.1 hypothetical protein LMJF_31_2070 [Leishmania major strain Friedlin]